MRLRTGILCLSMAGCATDPPKVAPMPTDAVIGTAIHKVFAETKLGGAPEVSNIRASLAPAPGDWIICLKSNADQSLRYAVFFQDAQYLSSRMAVVIDRCDTGPYGPAPPPPPPPAIPAPALTPASPAPPARR